MKKKKLKLSLNKMTVAKINDPGKIIGGETNNQCTPLDTINDLTCNPMASINAFCPPSVPPECITRYVDTICVS